MAPTILLNYLDKQYKKLSLENQTFHNRLENDRVAVIVEPRKHPMLFKIIRNIMYYVGDKWNLHIFTSSDPETISWIKDEFKNCSIRITPLLVSNLNTYEYSSLLTDISFWNMIPEENILIFQTDTMLFRKGIDKWIDDQEYNYDYVGANYYNPHHIAPNIQGIQGGLSLRKKSIMIDCIQNVKTDQIHKYRYCLGYDKIPDIIIPEDVFFTHACEILKKKVPSVEKRREFSIEADYYPHTLGHHGLKCSYLNDEQQRELLSNT